MPKRPTYSQIMERQDAADERLAHKQMLRDWEAARAGLPEVDAQFIKATREKLQCSRALFARRLCMSERLTERHPANERDAD